MQVALLGTALKGELLELLLCAGDEFKLCDKLLTADWVPEDENIPDDVIDARFLASTNAANLLVAPKDGKKGFVAVGNKFNDIIETRGFCNPLKLANHVYCL